MEKIILNFNIFALPSNSHIQNMERIIAQKPAERDYFISRLYWSNVKA
jgi:hypothetical protein